MPSIDDAPTGGEHAFSAWLDEQAGELDIEIALKREDEHWVALLMQFDIAGMGSTPRGAVTEAFELLFAYLGAYSEDGATLAEAMRPVPSKLSRSVNT